MLRSYAVPEDASQFTLARVRHLFLVTITGAVTSCGKKLDLPRCKATSAVAPRFVKPVGNTQASIMKHSSELQDTRRDYHPVRSVLIRSPRAPSRIIHAANIKPSDHDRRRGTWPLSSSGNVRAGAAATRYLPSLERTSECPYSSSPWSCSYP
jgi:hypothetical protein